MTQDPTFLPLLVATLTAGFAGLAFTAAAINGDPQLMAELFSFAKTVCNLGAGALIGLIAHGSAK
jgi:hypothetical protein